jgi:hypothetical protein
LTQNPATDLPAGTRPLGTLLRVVAAGVGGGLIFVALLGYRTDYAGHFLAGFGGTLGLLVFPLATLSPSLRWEPFGAAVIAILLGAGIEATLFNLAIFDPVDFFNQSLGAAFAAISVQGRPASLVSAFGSGLLALLFLSIGAVLAFA